MNMKRLHLLLPVLLLPLLLYAQRTVTGVVVDDNGEPLIGAGVVVEGDEQVALAAVFEGRVQGEGEGLHVPVGDSHHA